MAKPELVRVRLENGLEASVGVSFAKSHKLQLVDKPATDRRGSARRTKPKTSVAKKAAASKSTTNPEGGDQPASSSEESK